MKEQNMTIDINKLNEEELQQLASMLYNMGMIDQTKQVNERIAFLNGWMSETKEKEYMEKYC